MPATSPHPAAASPAPADWRQQAACGPTTAHLFFVPDGGETYQQRAAREAAALALCQACPVRVPCRAWLAATGDRWAIGGGTTPEQRGYCASDGTRLPTPTRHRWTVGAA
jgi:WhiB family redox-sensing transcriptional regulator